MAAIEVHDYYTIFDSRRRDRTQQLNQGLVFPFTEKSAGIGGVGGVLADGMGKVLEAEIISPFFFTNVATEARGSLASDGGIYVLMDELLAQSTITPINQKYHFNLEYTNVTPTDGLVTTNLSQVYAQVGARTSFVRPVAASTLFSEVVESSFEQEVRPYPLVNKYTFGDVQRPRAESMHFRFLGQAGDIVPISQAGLGGGGLISQKDYFDAQILWGTSPFTLQFTSPVLTSVDLSAVVNLSFDDFISTNLSVGIGPEVNPFHPHNAWTVSAYVAPVGSTPGTIALAGLQASTMYAGVISGGLATDPNRPGDPTLSYPPPATGVVGYAATGNSTCTITTPTAGLVTGVIVVFINFPIQNQSIRNALQRPQGYVITVVDANTFTIGVDLSGVASADRCATATFVLMRRPFVRVYVCDRDFQSRICMRIRMAGRPARDKGRTIQSNGIVPI